MPGPLVAVEQPAGNYDSPQSCQHPATERSASSVQSQNSRELLALEADNDPLSPLGGRNHPLAGIRPTEELRKWISSGESPEVDWLIANVACEPQLALDVFPEQPLSEREQRRRVPPSCGQLQYVVANSGAGVEIERGEHFVEQVAPGLVPAVLQAG